MSSDKLGRLPASLSTGVDSDAAESSPMHVDADAVAAPVAAPKPKRVRKPKAVAAPEPVTAQLDLQIPEEPAVTSAPLVAQIPDPVVEPPAIIAVPPVAAPAAPEVLRILSLPVQAPLLTLPTPAPKPEPAPVAPPAPKPRPRAERQRRAAAPTAAQPTAQPTAQPAAPTAAPTAAPPAAEAITVQPSVQPAPAVATVAVIDAPAVRTHTHAIAHRIHPVALGRKRDVLQHLLAQTPEQPTLVYTRTKHGADKIARFLERCGIKAAAIHGDKSQGARTRALSGFKSGELKALVVTDIAARLLDIEGLPFIISYDLPHIAEDYAQRVCRTGNADAPGLAVTIITQEESPQFRAVRDQLKYALEVVPLAGFEAAEPFDPERDPLPRPGGESEVVDAPAPVAAADTRRDGPGRGRRERRGRNGRGEGRPRDATPAAAGVAPDTASAVAASDELPEDAQPRTANPVRSARPARHERKPRPDRAQRGERQPRGDQQPRGDRQPGYDPPPLALHDDDDDGPGHGNSLAAPPPAQLVAGRRRGRRDPFATVVIDENRANIYDERQPDDYRDQWSVLGPDTNRPSWTYAEHQPQSLDAPVRRPNPPPVARRSGPGGGGPGRGPQSGQPRGQQRHGRPRRADGR